MATDRNETPLDEAALFAEALELDEPERRRFLQALDAQSSSIAARVRRLLEADAQANASLIDRSLDRLSAKAIRVLDDPKTIGHYRVLERIGEGGMGIIYLAEQSEPVKRKVAVKIIKAGLDTEELLARFASERQALALMNHNNIAKIYEAGTTDSGRPYFAMEFVPGIPITHYCDSNSLSVDKRLSLLIDACDAVQHAHLKGVIHRDIKPENILVAEENGKPVPKIIDFGVAKAVDHRLSERAAHTRIGGSVGTFEYMSPEQTALSPVNVDTRSDVYSLGAVLYELLTGARPTVINAEIESAEEIKSSIRNAPVLSLAERLSAMRRDERQQIAQQRGTTGADLIAEVTSELCWVTARALAKNPADRYQSAREMSADLTAYLNCDPVVAAPDKLRYRIKAYARKNRTAVLATAAVVLSLVAGIVVSSLGFVEARKERDLARAAQLESEATSQFLADMMSAAKPENSGRDVTVREVLGQAETRIDNGFADQPLLAARLLSSIGDTYLEMGALNEAESTLSKAHALFEAQLDSDHPDYLTSVNQLGRILQRVGRHDEAIGRLTQAFVGRREVLGLYHEDTIASLNSLGISYSQQGREQEALLVRERVLELDRELHGSGSPELLTSKNNLALSFDNVGRHAEAQSLFREVISGRTSLLGTDHPATLNARANLATSLSRAGDRAAAIAILEGVVTDASKVMGENDWRTLISKHQLARSQGRIGQIEASEQGFLEVIEARRQLFGELHPETIIGTVHYAEMLNDIDRHAEALPLLQQSVINAILVLPADSPLVATYRAELGRALVALGDFDEAETVLLSAYDTLLDSVTSGTKKSLAPFVSVSDNLIALYQHRLQPGRAEEIEARKTAAIDRLQVGLSPEAPALPFLDE